MADVSVSEKTIETESWQAAPRYFRTEWIPEHKLAMDALVPSRRAGGARRGAGRKKGIETIVVRIPAVLKPLVCLLVEEYKLNPIIYSTPLNVINDKLDIFLGKK